ncbi:FMN-binding protein MioC [Shewanella maritima]|uniref:FMN-binding protein MioC n=1 Tax=Shewanella maritima TaxID=2520507 RepID=UPI003736FF75
MTKVALLVGTTLGGTEYVADDMATQLTELGHEAAVFIDPKLDEISQFSLWILVCSTHGAGDLPDNIQPFFKQIMLFQPDLSAVKFATCAIGDSSYDTFCEGPKKLEKLFTQAGSKACVDKIEIDVQDTPIPEETALSWLSTWQSQI